MIAPLPANEEQRLEVLRQCSVLDTLAEATFDDITHLAASLCDTPIAAVSLIDTDRQWFKSMIGFTERQTSRDISFCAHTILGPDMMMVPDVQSDARFADNPMVTGAPHIRFYAGAPLITSDGYALGSLCVIDQAPRRLTPEQQTALRVLGRQITAQLELRRYAENQNTILMELQESQKTLQDYSVVLESKMMELEFINGELAKVNARLEALAMEDGLTGLKNHRTFQERLSDECAHAQRYGTPLALLLMDVDHFKTYNDTFGHPAGDEVLRGVARLLKAGARETDVVARYGGEEFALLLPGIDSEGAAALAERLRDSVASHPWPNRSVTISVGVSSWSPGRNTGKLLLQNADNLLYEAKRGGRNRVALER